MSAAKVVSMAKKQKGIKYTWGGADPKTGFDCSGLVVYCFKQALGMSLPHYTGDLIKKGKAVKRSDLQPADIIFPNNHHVGIYIGGGEYIHAPQTGEVVKTSQVTNFYAARRLI